MRWDHKVVSFDWVAPDQLLAHPDNARRHPTEQREALREMITKVGFVAPVIVNQRSGMLLDGHARVEEALSEGVEQLPVVTIDIPLEDEAIFLASFDHIAAMARWDAEMLGDLLDRAELESEVLVGMLEASAAIPAAADPNLVGLSDGDDANYSVVLTYKKKEYDEVVALLSKANGANNSERALNALRGI